MKAITNVLCAAILALALMLMFALPAAADKGKLTDAVRAEILALADKVETAIINKDLKLLQECCDPWDGLWIDAGHSAGWIEPYPIIYYGWEQIPSMLRDRHLYFLGWADGSGFPVYGRAPDIIWNGRWQIRELLESSERGGLTSSLHIMRRMPLPKIMQNNSGRELDAFTYPPANLIFAWEDDFHFVQYFSAGADGKAEEPFDNQFWFLLFKQLSEQPNARWCLSGIAHLDGWGI